MNGSRRIRERVEQSALLLFVILFYLLSACGEMSEEREKMNLDEGVISVELNGHNFDIPLRYMYGETIEKKGHWPKPKKERVKIDVLSLSVLMPTMKPYFVEDDAKWVSKGHGDRIELSISKGISRGVPSREMVRSYAEQGRRKREKDIYGLVHYSSKVGDTYFTREIGKNNVWIECDKEGSVEYPSCKYESEYDSEIIFEYYLSLKFLPQWKTIDEELKKLIAELELS